MDGKNERILCRCPHGHRLRGDVALIGSMIRCPKCQATFIFGYAIRETLSDNAVVKILEEGPGPTRLRQTIPSQWSVT
ncbi:hypothetical protein CKO51_31675 [Rhodopirellula sp. SM50]|nr:hypothetical protein CKO51_31675 [Rhodopirellula sp. SM50]